MRLHLSSCCHLTLRRLVFGVLSAGILALPAPLLRAQTYISPDNTLTGHTYFDGDAEVAGYTYLDSGLTVGANLSVNGTATVYGNISAANVYASNFYYGSIDPHFTITGNLELNSDFFSALSKNHGVANSWIHSSLDLGDLNTDYWDTPAFNIGQDTDGTYNYPTINFTGYDGNTTWVWKQNGLAAQTNENPSYLLTQMALSNEGLLTLYSPTGESMQFDPQNHRLKALNGNGVLVISDNASHSITINASNQTITFSNGSIITPQGSPAAITLNTSSSGQAYGVGASATASYAFALGNGTLASGNGSFAIGNHVTSAFYDAIVLGQWNAAISGSGSGNTTWSATDPLFVIGNGADSGNTSNALVMLKNGNTTINGSLTVGGSATLNGPATVVNGTVHFNGNVTVQPQGNILMGQFQ